MDHSALLNTLHYDPETGHWTWKEHRGGSAPQAGHRAGSVKQDGYRKLMLDRRHYQEHMLAWFYMTGEWPPEGMEVEHRNRDRSDNRWCNLRLAEKWQNSGNTAVRPGNKLQVKGVRYHEKDGKYHARMTVRGEKMHLGSYDTLEQAQAAYELADYLYRGEFASHG